MSRRKRRVKPRRLVTAVFVRPDGAAELRDVPVGPPTYGFIEITPEVLAASKAGPEAWTAVLVFPPAE